MRWSKFQVPRQQFVNVTLTTVQPPSRFHTDKNKHDTIDIDKQNCHPRDQSFLAFYIFHLCFFHVQYTWLIALIVFRFSWEKILLHSWTLMLFLRSTMLLDRPIWTFINYKPMVFLHFRYIKLNSIANNRDNFIIILQWHWYANHSVE